MEGNINIKFIVGIKYLCFQNVDIFYSKPLTNNLFMLRYLPCSLINRHIKINTLRDVVLVKCLMCVVTGKWPVVNGKHILRCINTIQQDATVCRYSFTEKLFYMFRVSISPIIRST